MVFSFWNRKNSPHYIWALVAKGRVMWKEIRGSLMPDQDQVGPVLVKVCDSSELPKILETLKSLVLKQNSTKKLSVSVQFLRNWCPHLSNLGNWYYSEQFLPRKINKHVFIDSKGMYIYFYLISPKICMAPYSLLNTSFIPYSSWYSKLHLKMLEKLFKFTASQFYYLWS